MERGDKVIGIEVKSGLREGPLPGMASFEKKYPLHKKLLVGASGIPVEEFLRFDMAELF